MPNAEEIVTEEEKRKTEADKQRGMIQRFNMRLRKSSQAKAEKVKLWNLLDTFDRGEQWKGAPIPPWIPKPVTNMIKYVRTTKRANLTSNIPSAKFYSNYQSDDWLITQLQKAYEFVWELNKMPMVVRRCIDRSILQGTAVVYVYNDDREINGRYYGEGDINNQLYRGDIKVKRIPLGHFFPDPDATCLYDCKWITVTENVPVETIKNNPTYQEYAGQKLTNWVNGTIDREDAHNGQIFDRDVNIGDGAPSVSGDEMVTLYTHYERYLGKDHRWHLDITYYLHDADFILYRIEDAMPNEYPFAVLYDEEEENDFFGTSTCMDIIENQKIINRVQQTASIIGVLHQNPQKVVSKQAGLNAQEVAQTGTLPGKTYAVNGDPSAAIHILRPPEIPRGLFDLDNAVKANVKDMTGITEAYTGESVGSLTTSTGVSDLIERATIRDRDKMKQIDEFVERISHLIMLFIVHTWTDEREMMRIQPDGEPMYEDFKPVDPEIARELSWRVRSNIYAASPTTAAKKNQDADTLMQMELQFQPKQQGLPSIITPMEWLQMKDIDPQMKALIMQRMQNELAQQQEKEQQMTVDNLLQLAQMISNMQLQGLPPEQIQMEAMQMAEQLLGQSAPQGVEGHPAPTAGQAPEQAAFQSNTSDVAMQNMMQG